MKQSELAAALGLDPAAVSRLKQRGMPTDSVEAAKAWRRRNVAPYYKSPTSPPARPTASPIRAQEYPDDHATIDGLLAAVAAHAIMPGPTILAVVRGLADAAAEMVAAGRPLGAIETALRAAMSAVPVELREQTQVPISVLTVLCAEVVDYIESSFTSPAEREADRAVFLAGGEAAAAAMGEFWYAVAAGEYGIPD